MSNNLSMSIATLHTKSDISTARISSLFSFIAILFSSVGYGIVFLPVKKYHSGDGMFFQWIMTNAIFLPSFIVAGFYNFPKFEPFVMLGGFLFATGNICVVPIVQRIGLAMGGLLWSSTSLALGWASGRFGWFGIHPQLPNNFTLNYIGFALTALSAILFALVKSNVGEIKMKNIPGFAIIHNEKVPQQTCTLLDVIKGYFYANARIVGVSLSLFSGMAYGFHMIPVMYVKNRFPNATQKDVEYIFAQCSGMYVGSTIYFLAYCIIKRNVPILYPNVILPATMSGFIWLASYVAYFIGAESLSPAISHPIVFSVSGSISTLVNVIIFKEVTGTRNFIVIIMGIIVAATGSSIISISKVI